MPTVAEVLKSSGFDDAAIAGLDQRALTAFQGVLSTAEQERVRAETAQRAANELFEREINPALNAWGNKEATLSAERDYYKTLAEKAKDGGFIAEVPPFQNTTGNPGTSGNPGQSRNPNDGRWTQVPGSPDLREIENRAGNAIAVITDLNWKYQTLFGQPLPESPTALAAEAAQRRMPLNEYAAQKYNFSQREKELADAKQKEHDDAIRKAEREAVEKQYAERYGSNPNVRQAEPSRFADLQKGVSEGTRQDPLKMTPEQRRAATRQTIHKDIAEAKTAA